MTTHKNRSSRPSGAISQAALLMSLAHCLGNPKSPLGRQAATIAHRLSDGSATSADLDAAAAVLARLLDETDAGLALDDEGLLDSGFDA